MRARLKKTGLLDYRWYGVEFNIRIGMKLRWASCCRSNKLSSTNSSVGLKELVTTGTIDRLASTKLCRKASENGCRTSSNSRRVDLVRATCYEFSQQSFSGSRLSND